MNHKNKVKPVRELPAPPEPSPPTPCSVSQDLALADLAFFSIHNRTICASEAATSARLNALDSLIELRQALRRDLRQNVKE